MSGERVQQETTGSTVVTISEAPEEPVPIIREAVIHLNGDTDTAPRVQWATDTVDNENMGKKSSKCCCIYKRKKKWDESSSDSDSDCESAHCRGHVEKRRHHHPDDPGPGPSGGPSGDVPA